MSIQKKSKKSRFLQSRKKLFFCVFLAVLFLFALLSGKNLAAHFLNKEPLHSRSTPQDDAKRIDSLCRNSKDKDRCYPNEFYTLSKKTNLKNAITTLLQIQKINPKDTRGCHFISHKISQAETEKDPKQWKEIIKKAPTSMCTGGFIHGVLESHLADDPSFEINNLTITTICRDLVGGGFGEGSCYHNMGHLVLTQSDGNMQKAVSKCSELSEFFPKYECLSGTFMENITEENLLAHEIRKKRAAWDNARAEEVEKLCTTQVDLPAQACWREISHLYFAIFRDDPKKAYGECKKAPESSMQDACFLHGAGNIIHSGSFSDKNIIELCHQFSLQDPLFGTCMNQVLGSLLTSSSDNIDRANYLCTNTPDSYKKQCFSKIIQTLKDNNPSKNMVQNACSQIPLDIQKEICEGEYTAKPL